VDAPILKVVDSGWLKLDRLWKIEKRPIVNDFVGFVELRGMWSGNGEKKAAGVTVSTGLLKGAYSRARSHYCPTRVLLAARFPSWPDSLFLRQPGHSGLLHRLHVDARLSADTCSTQATIQQDPQSQVIHYNKPPRSRITEVRHTSSCSPWYF